MNFKTLTRVLARRRFFLIALGGAFFLGAARGDEMSIRETPSAPDAFPASATAPLSPAEAQLSLDVESAPMAQVFSLIEAMTQLRARYAAPPDTILSAHFDEEPLLPALEKMLDGSGWTAELSGDSLFLNAPQNAQWKSWRGETAPPSSWNLAPGAREYSLPAVRLKSSPDAPSQVTATLDDHNTTREISPQEKAARAAQDALWQSAPLSFEARRVPGIRVSIGEKTDDESATGAAKTDAAKSDDEKPDEAADTGASENVIGKSARRESTIGTAQSASEKADAEKAAPGEARADNASTRAVWLRCDFTLRVVPARLYLSISTPTAATLFIDGAPVLMQRSGQSRVEISQFVKRGANRVALQWQNAPLSAPQPLLRYEWQTDLAP